MPAHNWEFLKFETVKTVVQVCTRCSATKSISQEGLVTYRDPDGNLGYRKGRKIPPCSA